MPNEFNSIAELEQHLMAFQSYYETIASPFEWKFTKNDIDKLLSKFDDNHVRRLKTA